MMDKLVSVRDESPDGTGYNDPPVNLKEITEDEFAKSGFSGATFAYVEFRQMFVNKDLSPGKLTNGKMVQARLFWFQDGTGVAVSCDYWGGKVHYYSFGCNHHFEQKTLKAGEPHHCNKCNTDVQEPWMDLIKEDTGWGMDGSTSIPIRGIRDYNRTITFTRALEEAELRKVVRFLTKADCPGWTGVGHYHRGNGVYQFNTTHDSSD